MNLIEQLGGHEKAKEILSRERNSENIDPVIYLNGNEILIDAICGALLEYRRQHNIFEVGDKVVWRKSLTPISSLMEITDLDGETWGIRHATDAEIKAGKRLEVK